MTAAAIYARLSQDRDGTQTATTRQIADCRALTEHLKWDVAGVYEDTDVTAYDRRKRRPAYERMLDDMTAGRLDAIVVYDQDRLVRHPAELERFIDIADAHGVRLAAVTGTYDISTDVGRFIARSLGNLANMESAAKSRRIRRKHLELAEQGQLSGGGRRPFGYEADRITIRENEAAEIRDAVRRVLAGESVRGITYDWRKRRVATITGAVWSPTTVKRLLASGRISGQREHRGQITGPAVWPAIVTPEQTARLREILSSPDRNRGLGVIARSYLLTGFVRCGRCDVAMTTRPTARGKRRYVCTQDRGGCDRCGISADHLEPLIVDAVMEHLDTPAFTAALRTEGDDDHQALCDQLAIVESRLEELAADYYVHQLISRPEFMAARAPLETEIGRLRAAAARHRRLEVLDGIDNAERLRAVWPAMGLDQRRAVLAAVVASIVVEPTKRENNRFDPERVSVNYVV